jgi:hypothetical protein
MVKVIKLGTAPLYFNGGVAEPGVETEVPTEIYEMYKAKLQLVEGEPVALNPDAQTAETVPQKSKTDTGKPQTKREKVLGV